MSHAAALAPASSPKTEVLRRLEAICGDRELPSLGQRLADLAALVQDDMRALEADFAVADTGRAVHAGAAHLLNLGGKRLRPMCVALAARIGTGFDERARTLAVAVELVHNATLLHDDVIDVGDSRRGAPTTRAVWGNAVSIFAGDWLLVDALRRVRRVGVPGTLERLLDVIDEMIVAESLQLEGRGRLETTRETWTSVVTGKTGALFRWATYAGGRVGGLADLEVEALEKYGSDLGIAFQAVDDLLDLSGDREATGKALFADLREGKMTYPLILAQERDESMRPLLRAILDEESVDERAEQGRFADVAAILERTGALRDCRALADAHAKSAVDALSILPVGPATDALITVAEATVARRA